MALKRDRRREPLRMCVVCRRRFEKAEMARYVVDQMGCLIPDECGIMPGRGWYCCGDPVCHAKFLRYRPKKKAGKGGKRLGSRGEI